MECCIPLPFGRISLRRFISYNVARTCDWVSNPWYMGKFAGSAVPTPRGTVKNLSQIDLAVLGPVLF